MLKRANWKLNTKLLMGFLAISSISLASAQSTPSQTLPLKTSHLLKIVRQTGTLDLTWVKAPEFRVALQAELTPYWIEAEAPSGVCTMDFNQWGHSSACTCSNDTLTYNMVSGYCEKVLQTEPIDTQNTQLKYDTKHTVTLTQDGSTTLYSIKREWKDGCGSMHYALLPVQELQTQSEETHPMELMDHTNRMCRDLRHGQIELALSHEVKGSEKGTRLLAGKWE